MDFTQEELIAIIERTTRINKFFTNFFPKRNTHLAEKLEVQIKKGKKKMAPFVANRVGGKLLLREGFETHNITTPKLAPTRILTVDDISKRILGEDIYSKKTPEQRAMELFAKDLTDLEESISNRVEWMARSILLGETIDITDEDSGVDINVNFNFTNKDTLVGGAKWSEASSDPIADLKRWRKNVIRKSGVSPKLCLMGENAYNAFINNPKVKEMLNILRISLGEIAPTVVDEALTFQGKIIGLEIYTYDEWFLDDDGVERPMLPLDTVLLLPKEVGSIEYGSVTIMEEDEQFRTYESEIVPIIFADRKNHAKELTLVSRALTTPYDVDAWAVLIVVDEEV